jgi:L-glyceraldehyde 3-phosphate reductase
MLPVLNEEGIGAIAFSPLAQGLLTDRYLDGRLPADSRAAGSAGFLRAEHLTDDRLQTASALNAYAQGRGQSLAQLALRWVLRQPAVTSALIGASRPTQVIEAVQAGRMPALDAGELEAIEMMLAQSSLSR